MRIIALALLTTTAQQLLFGTQQHRLLFATTQAFTTTRTLSTNHRRRYQSTTTSSSTVSLSTSAAAAAAAATMTTIQKVLVPIADDSEEIETACITDTLTRFGAEVTIASVMPQKRLLCTMSRGMKVHADIAIEEIEELDTYDLIVCPGGMPGAQHLADCPALTTLLRHQQQNGKAYAAMCAAPAVIFAPQGLLDGITGGGATCYPAEAFRTQLQNPSEANVVTSINADGGSRVTTSKGPGTALEFALALGEQLYGHDKRQQIQKEMLC